ncbi:MAG: phage DNA encapsidation protein [Clostridia bacterium]|nr:phage DNA encapsidation protein [Clostridia bacterium]
MVKVKYANLHTMLEHDSLYKMAMSLRGDGKTTELKIIALESFYENGKAPLFCRRFDTEFTDEFFTDFFDDVRNANRAELFDGRKIEFKKSKKITSLFLDGKKAITFVPLSMAGRVKSSLSRDTHKNIFIDEYIPLDGRYLKSEVTAITELYKTIDRRHDDNYIMIGANKVDRFNPLFSEFGITDWHKGRNYYRDGLFELLMLSDTANVKTDDATRIGRIMTQTNYNEYAHGQFLNDKTALVKERQGLNVFVYIVHKNKLYGAFINGYELIIDRVQAKRYAVPTVCLNAEPSHYSATSLKIAKEIRLALAEYKYNNALFFQNEIYYNELKQLYDYI